MTPEQAQHHLTMLKLGECDEYDRALDRLLLEQDPLSDLVLELACCMSDRRQTISVLHNFLLDHPADQQVLYDAYLTGLRRRYESGAMTPRQAAEYLYSLIVAHDWEEPWSDLYRYCDMLDAYEDGLISQSVFEHCFEAAFLRDEMLNYWELRQAENAKKSLCGKLRDIFTK